MARLKNLTPVLAALISVSSEAFTVGGSGYAPVFTGSATDASKKTCIISDPRAGNGVPDWMDCPADETGSACEFSTTFWIKSVGDPNSRWRRGLPKISTTSPPLAPSSLSTSFMPLLLLLLRLLPSFSLSLSASRPPATTDAALAPSFIRAIHESVLIRSFLPPPSLSSLLSTVAPLVRTRPLRSPTPFPIPATSSSTCSSLALSS